MKQEGLKFFTDTHLTSIGLLIFFLFFLGVIYWVSRKDNKRIYSELEKMPLNDAEFTYER